MSEINSQWMRCITSERTRGIVILLLTLLVCITIAGIVIILAPMLMPDRHLAPGATDGNGRIPGHHVK